MAPSGPAMALSCSLSTEFTRVLSRRHASLPKNMLSSATGETKLFPTPCALDEAHGYGSAVGDLTRRLALL